MLFPYDVEKEFGAKGRIPVKASFNGYAGSLVKYAHPQHRLGILKSIRDQIGADVDDRIQVEVWKDEMPRTVDVPAQFHIAMKHGGVLSFFESLSYAHRREYCRWISGAKTEPTRLKRIAKAIEMLKGKVTTPDTPIGLNHSEASRREIAADPLGRILVPQVSVSTHPGKPTRQDREQKRAYGTAHVPIRPRPIEPPRLPESQA